jgi:hypothetical protein
MHVAVTTPAETIDFVRSYSSIVSSFPQKRSGSASAFSVSRLAQRLLGLQPTCSPSRLNGSLHRRLRQLCYLHCRFDCYRVERTSSRVGLSPTEKHRLSRRTRFRGVIGRIPPNQCWMSGLAAIEIELTCCPLTRYAKTAPATLNSWHLQADGEPAQQGTDGDRMVRREPSAGTHESGVAVFSSRDSNHILTPGRNWGSLPPKQSLDGVTPGGRLGCNPAHRGGRVGYPLTIAEPALEEGSTPLGDGCIGSWASRRKLRGSLRNSKD